ncbi:tRNA lysidine(34) synthetase TilS [Methylosinus sp. H3A]|uniref:tRNA lysidine(34) synthetase TilS n=1 Tax=Methylosinus sp. H3A TaxID=2785786 RepID=UPI0018C2E558|nr:tRNA lysidine(34) synthetase TilS [Methylosinus sp. H3A]MBG0811268.1 tRNA lysidine(34) synthetase TilS [Methylosinus sp. H3A]
MPAEPPPPDPDRALAPLAAHDALLLAVSGGPDSIALALLAARWPLRTQKRIEIATVDHGLRAEAAQEAAQVGEWARGLGFAHHILRWEGEKPSTRIQERAREARYRLLCERAREIGATGIVTAHHADDQAETVLFRLTRGSGIAGLAAMAGESRIDGLALLRPLLGFRKAELERLCAEADHPFFRDPSNENPAYARVRLRRLAVTLAAEGLDAAALLRLRARAARAEEALAWSAARAASELPAERGEGRFRIEAEALRTLPREMLLRLLAAEIVRIGGGAPRLERLERAGERLADALARETRFKTTLGGATVLFEGGAVAISPEPPRHRDGARNEGA